MKKLLMITIAALVSVSALTAYSSREAEELDAIKSHDYQPKYGTQKRFGHRGEQDWRYSTNLQ